MGIAWKLFLLFVVNLGGRKTRELDEAAPVYNLFYSKPTKPLRSRLDWIKAVALGENRPHWFANSVQVEPNGLTIWMKTHCSSGLDGRGWRNEQTKLKHRGAGPRGETTAFTIIHVHLNKCRSGTGLGKQIRGKAVAHLRKNYRIRVTNIQLLRRLERVYWSVPKCTNDQRLLLGSTQHNHRGTRMPPFELIEKHRYTGGCMVDLRRVAI